MLYIKKEEKFKLIFKIDDDYIYSIVYYLQKEKYFPLNCDMN